MALFKCKMCGGDLEITAGVTVAECEYCGAQQTIPKLDDDRRANLYDRANHFRRNNEFDKAMGIYEQILNEDNTDAEAYWSLVLCRYGIEYVEDPSTRKRVPTVNRAQFTSIFDDDNYKSALQNADSYQRAIYEAEAKAINEIQKGILAISQREEPFDVFICYKESDNAGRRTPDSVLANDLYHQLVQEGFKVFFARITLEDKLGSAYEPYIFAALNSAKVMVVLGTRPEYFNAVWVKNEWSRYLSLIKNGAKKMLIPAYKDMDPYDLPEEFSHLQAQDMSKLGFMQDLIRGIKKILDADASRATVVKETIVAGNANTAPLLKRAFMFLEDGDWNSADEYCEKVLDLDPECAEAYLGKLMAEMQVKKRGDLNNCKNPFDRHNHYQKAMRFAGDALKKELQGYIDSIVERNLSRAYNDATFSMKAAKSEADFKNAAAKSSELKGYKDSKELAKKCIEEAECARLSALYNSAASAMASAKTEKQFKDAATSFSYIKGFKDAEKLAANCLAKAEEARLTALYDAAFATMTAAQTEQQYKEAAEQFGAIKTFRDADSLLAECHVKAEETRLTALYDTALAAMNSAKTEQQYKAAAEQFDAIKTFSDAQEQYYACLESAEASCKDAIYSAGIVHMSNSVKRVEDLQAAIEEFQKIYGWKDTDDKIIECQDLITKINAEEFEREQQRERDRLARIAAEKKRKRLAIVVAAIVCACMVFAVVLYTVIIPNSKYNDAIALMESGKYSDAISAFEALDGYKDSVDKIAECTTAILDGKYDTAVELMTNGKYKDAERIFAEIEGHKDSKDLLNECIYQQAVAFRNSKDWNSANPLFERIKGYKDSATLIHYHKYSVIDSVEETCISAGHKTYLCDCGEGYTDNFQQLGHDYIAATCTTAAECARCGFTTDSPLGHTTDTNKCKRCGEVTFKPLTWGNTYDTFEIDLSHLPEGNYVLKASKKDANPSWGHSVSMDIWYYRNGKKSREYSVWTNDTIEVTFTVKANNNDYFWVNPFEGHPWTITIEAQ